MPNLVFSPWSLISHRTRAMYPKAHRVFVACSEAMVRSLADKALRQSNRKPDLECNCQPAIPNIAESSESTCNISLCRIPDCWTPTVGLDGVRSLNVHLCKNGLEAHLTGITRALGDVGSSSSTPYDRGHQYVTHQYQYACCTALARHDPTPPPGVAGNRWIDGVEEDMVCPKMYRYRCANVYTPPPKLNLTRHGREVFWRVDSVMTSDGYDMTVVPGPIWSFTTSPPPELEQTRGFTRPFGRPEGPCLAGSGRLCTTRYSDNSSISLPSSKQSDYVDLVSANITIDSRYFHPNQVYVLQGIRVCIEKLVFSAGINKLGMKFKHSEGERTKELWLASENGKVSRCVDFFLLTVNPRIRSSTPTAICTHNGVDKARLH